MGAHKWELCLCFKLAKSELVGRELQSAVNVMLGLS